MIYSLTIPNVLTLIRFIGAPFLLAPLLVAYLPRKTVRTAVGLAMLFGLLGLTDFFDGYYARAWGQSSLLGSLLDPVADKMLVASVCCALVACQRLWYGWAILFLGREFFVMGLREVALAHGCIIPVAIWGKWKTLFQFAYLGFLIITSYNEVRPWMRGVEYLLLAGAVVCTLASGWYYALQAFHNVPNLLV